MSLLIINTLPEDDKEVRKAINILTEDLTDYRVVNAYELKISHCLGCCECMLSTPGTCCIQDDYTDVFNTLLNYDDIVFVSDTALNFLSHRTLDIMQRHFPLVTVSAVYKNGKILHKSRYDKSFRVGILYKGSPDEKILSEWFGKYTEHFSSESLGTVPISKVEELRKCIL